MANHAVCWVEIYTKNLKKAKEFYGKLFGWDFDDSMGPTYSVFKPKEGLGGGIMENEHAQPGLDTVIYFDVDDVTPTLEKAKELGAEIANPKTEIPGAGFYGHFKDPDGNIIGLHSTK
jgi:predicted enzyme related to lactoylglutathione lyase